MSNTLGKDCKLFRNTADYANPTWSEVLNIEDLSIPHEKERAEARPRDKNVVLSKGGFRDLGLTFTIYRDRDDASYDAFRSAFLSGTTVDVWAADGASDGAATAGWRFEAEVFSFNENEPGSEFSTAEVTLYPAISASNDPEWKDNAGT